MTIPNMNPAVHEAIDELRRQFPGHAVDAEPDDAGGAYVTVATVFLGSQYEPTTSWLGFHITFQYPFADIYAHFCTSFLKRVDGKPHCDAIHLNKEWKTPSRTEPAILVSRKSRRWDAGRDTAATKLMQVLEWIRSL